MRYTIANAYFMPANEWATFERGSKSPEARLYYQTLLRGDAQPPLRVERWQRKYISAEGLRVRTPMGLLMDLSPIVSRLRSGLLHGLAARFHYLLFFGIIAGIAFTYIINRPDFAVRGLIFFVPALIVAFFLHRVHARGIRTEGPLVILHFNRRILEIAFVILFILSLVSISLASYRPWHYFVLLVALFGIIFLQIFGEIPNPYSILIEISCAMANLIFGLQLKYPFFFGFTDVIPHLYLSKIIFLTGRTIPIDLDSTYANFPLYHIFIATGKSILGTDMNLAFIILTSISFIVLIWVVYLLANQIHPNTQLSLLVCLLFATTPIVVTYSTYVITRVMAFAGFLFLIFLAQRRIRAPQGHPFYILIIIISIYIILVHQVSILQILPLLAIIFLLEEVVGDYITIEPKILALITVTFSAYWLYVSTLMSEIVVTKTGSITTEGIQQVRSQVQIGNEYSFLYDNIDTAITIFLVLFAIGYILWAYRFRYPSLIALFALIMIPLYFPTPLAASSLAMITFRTDRLALFVSPFFAIIIGVGLVLLVFIMYRNRYTRTVSLVCGLLIFSFLCQSALIEDNASDCVDFSTNQGRVYFTQAELNAFSFVTNHITYGSTITTDSPSGKLLGNKIFSKTQALGLPYFYGGRLFDSSDPISFSGDIFLLRSKEFEQNGLEFHSAGEATYPTVENIKKFSQLSNSSQKIFDNRGVVISGR